MAMGSGTAETGSSCGYHGFVGGILLICVGGEWLHLGRKQAFKNLEY